MQNRIGEARREYANRVGKFTQEDAAAFFGVSLSTYKKWEQGQGMMNGEQLREIAMKDDVSTDYLLCRVDYAVIDMANDLLDEEQEIVDIMRSITPTGRQQLLVFARGIAASYPKNNQLLQAKTS